MPILHVKGFGLTVTSEPLHRPVAEERLVNDKYSPTQKIWRPPARISLSASLK